MCVYIYVYPLIYPTSHLPIHPTTRLILKFWKCLSPLFALQCPQQNFEDKDIQNYKFTRCFYVCGSRSPTLRKEHRLRVLETVMRICGRERKEERGRCEKIA